MQFIFLKNYSFEFYHQSLKSRCNSCQWISDWIFSDFAPLIGILIGRKCYSVLLIMLFCRFPNSQLSKGTGLNSSVKVAVESLFCQKYFFCKSLLLRVGTIIPVLLWWKRSQSDCASCWLWKRTCQMLIYHFLKILRKDLKVASLRSTAVQLKCFDFRHIFRMLAYLRVWMLIYHNYFN